MSKDYEPIKVFTQYQWFDECITMAVADLFRRVVQGTITEHEFKGRAADLNTAAQLMLDKSQIETYRFLRDNGHEDWSDLLAAMDRYPDLADRMWQIKALERQYVQGMNKEVKL